MSNSAAIAPSRSPQHPGDALRAYLPTTLLQSAARHDTPVWYEWLEGSLMHCDISGFTAMSEDLAARGKEGAELMVDVLNSFFDVMLGIATSYGGVQMKFGGDAMLLYFAGPGHANLAGACGLAMQKAMRPFGRVRVGGGVYRLRMRAGIHSGRFFSASAGHPTALLHYVLTGADVSRAAAVEAAAGLGHVACTPATANLLEGAVLRPEHAGIFRLTDVPALDAGRNVREPEAAGYEPYIPPTLRSGRTLGAREHRRVTVVFINVLGIENLLVNSSEDGVLDVINGYVCSLVDLLQRHRGHLLGSDVADHGDKFIALFGAPVADERQEAGAMRFALELQDAIARAGLPVRLKIGLNTGYVFAGEVGSAARREYTVIGDAVNLSARLMSAAPEGSVLVSAATGNRAAGDFDLQRLRPIRVKGKRDPIPIFRLRGSSGVETSSSDARIFGREHELSALLQAARSSRRRGRLAYVWGEPGIGKSALTSALASRLEAGGWTTVTARNQPHTSGTPFAAWTDFLPRLGAAFPSLPDAETLAESLEAGPAEGSDPRAFREAAVVGLAETVARAARERPLFVIFEDAHWADDSSMDALARLGAGRHANLFVCTTSREPAPSVLSPAFDLHLAELPADAARELALASGLDAQIVDTVIERSRGNPLFLTEFIRAGSLSGDLPDTVSDLMMVRIDALAPDERQVLRTASVVGQQFGERLLMQLAQPLPPERVRAALPALMEGGFATVQSADPPAYAFTHALLSDVAYESAPFAFRRRMHMRAGELLESEHAGEVDQVSGLLLHHFERAGHAAKAVRYAGIAGDRSARVFANREALDYYKRGAQALAGLKDTAVDQSLLLERRADILEVTGRHSDAAEDFRASLDAWASSSRRPRARYLPWRTGGPEREAVLCRKISVSRERAADYDDALRWLERARDAAPAHAARLRSQLSATTCMTLVRKGEYSEAIRYGREAARLAGRTRDLNLTAYAHNMVGNALIESGRLREAVRHLRPAVRLYHEARDFAGQASSNNNLGSCYQLLGMYDAALYYYDVALRADERTGDEVDAAIVHNNMAETLLLLDREEDALERLDQVLSIAEKEPDLADLAAWAHVTTGRCYRALGKAAEAERHLRKGARQLRRLDAHGLLGEALVDLAEQSLAVGRHNAAVLQARRAISHARRLNALLPESRARRILGQGLIAMGRTREGEKELRAALEISGRVDAEHEEAHARFALGRHYLGAGRRAAARRLLVRAHRYFSRAGARRQTELVADLLTEAGA